MSNAVGRDFMREFEQANAKGKSAEFLQEQGHLMTSAEKERINILTQKSAA